MASRIYIPKYLPSFYSSLSKYDKLKKSMIEKKIENFLTNPKHFSKHMKGLLQGKREIKVISDIRILIMWCEECRKLEFTEVNGCDFCNETNDNDIIFILVGSHKIINRFERRIGKRRFELGNFLKE